MKKVNIEDRRKEIIDAARKVFFKNGYGKTSVDMIAETAGLAKGTLYLYFKSKKQLFVAVTMDLMARFEEVIKGWRDKGGDYPVRLKSFINMALTFMENNEELFDIFQNEYQNISKTFTKAEQQNMMKRHHEMMGMFGEVVQEGQAEGFIRKVNPGVAGVVLMHMIGAFSKFDLFTTDKKVINKKSSEIMDIFLKGVGK